MKSGKVILQAQLLEQTSPLSELDLREDQAPEPQHLVLGERKPAGFTVQVVDAAGTPKPGAFVFLEEEAKGMRLVLADGEGKATVTLDPPPVAAGSPPSPVCAPIAQADTSEVQLGTGHPFSLGVYRSIQRTL